MNFENDNGFSNLNDNEKPQEQLNTSVNEENPPLPQDTPPEAANKLGEASIEQVDEGERSEVSVLGGGDGLEECNLGETAEQSTTQESSSSNEEAEQSTTQEPSSSSEEAEQSTTQESSSSSEEAEQSTTQESSSSSEEEHEKFTAVVEVDASAKSPKKDKAGWISTVILALICAFVAFVNFGWLYCVKVEGDSMETTLQTGDYLAVDKLADIERGDVIVFTGSFAGASEKAYIKRVVAMAGDTVRISSGNLYLQKNGEQHFIKVDYPGVRGATYYQGKRDYIYEEVVPQGHIFVLGDNRENSKDSRVFGFIPLECVDGVVPQYVIERKDGFLGKICEAVFKTREFVYIKILKRA